MIVDIEKVREVQDYRTSINRTKLEDIELHVDGKPVAIPQKAIDRWRFMGMSNWNFFADEFWCSPDLLKDDDWKHLEGEERKIMEGDPSKSKPQGIIEAWRK